MVKGKTAMARVLLSLRSGPLRCWQHHRGLLARSEHGWYSIRVMIVGTQKPAGWGMCPVEANRGRHGVFLSLRGFACGNYGNGGIRRVNPQPNRISIRARLLLGNCATGREHWYRVGHHDVRKHVGTNADRSCGRRDFRCGAVRISSMGLQARGGSGRYRRSRLSRFTACGNDSRRHCSPCSM